MFTVNSTKSVDNSPLNELFILVSLFFSFNLLFILLYRWFFLRIRKEVKHYPFQLLILSNVLFYDGCCFKLIQTQRRPYRNEFWVHTYTRVNWNSVRISSVACPLIFSRLNANWMNALLRDGWNDPLRTAFYAGFFSIWEWTGTLFLLI